MFETRFITDNFVIYIQTMKKIILETISTKGISIFLVYQKYNSRTSHTCTKMLTTVNFLLKELPYSCEFERI